MHKSRPSIAPKKSLSFHICRICLSLSKLSKTRTAKKYNHVTN